MTLPYLQSSVTPPHKSHRLIFILATIGGLALLFAGVFSVTVPRSKVVEGKVYSAPDEKFSIKYSDEFEIRESTEDQTYFQQTDAEGNIISFFSVVANPAETFIPPGLKFHETAEKSRVQIGRKTYTSTIFYPTPYTPGPNPGIVEFVLVVSGADSIGFVLGGDTPELHARAREMLSTFRLD